MAFIIILTIMIYVIAIIWSWNNLGQIEKSKKIAVIIVGIVLTYIITFIVFALSKNNVNYNSVIIKATIKNAIVAIFTGVNACIFIPYISKQLEKIHEGEIEKEKFMRKIMTLIIIIVFLMSFECGYMKKTQQGILKIYNHNIEK